MKKTVCLILILIMSLPGLFGMFCASAEETQKDALADAFTGDKKLKLVHVAQKIAPDETAVNDFKFERFVDVSPDGKTALYIISIETPAEETLTEETESDTERLESMISVEHPGRKKRKESSETQAGETKRTVIRYRLCIVRDGEMIPVRLNAVRGDGDPTGQLDKIIDKFWTALPGSEGISWSADGRYAVLSQLERARNFERTIQVPVLDTAEGEMWFADSYPDDHTNDGYGNVLLSRISRNGEYVYYLAYRRENSQSTMCFCRVTTKGGKREILCETPSNQYAGYYVGAYSDLYETADGTWLLLGIIGNGRDDRNPLELFRFVQYGEKWRMETLYSSVFTVRLLTPTRFTYSSVSGYSLITLANMYASSLNDQAVQEGYIRSDALKGIMSRINLLRIRPEDHSGDLWYLHQSGDDPQRLETVSGEIYLMYLMMSYMGLNPGYPEGYSPENAIRNPIPQIGNICFSPDGRYALLYVRNNMRDDLYLLDPETMEVRFVETPEGTVSMNLAAAAPYGRSYGPRMVWHPDGTIVLLNAEGSIQFFRLEAE